MADESQVGLEDGPALLFPDAQLLLPVEVAEVVQLGRKLPHPLQQRVQEVAFELLVPGHAPQRLAFTGVLAVKLAVVVLLEGDERAEVEAVPLELAPDGGCSSDRVVVDEVVGRAEVG